MRVLEVEQGSQAWKDARLGIPTASCFDRIVTAKTLKMSGQSEGYINELVAEWLLGRPLDDGDSGYMNRGTAMEDEARRWYEFQRGVTVETVGFVLRDDGAVGGSPDGLVGDDGGVEIKCPSAKVHVGYLRNDVSVVHRLQVQGYLWLTGRKWWDVVSYNPDIDSALVRSERDPKVMDAFDVAVPDFLRRLDEARDQMRARGMTGGLAARKEQYRRELEATASAYGIEIPEGM